MNVLQSCKKAYFIHPQVIASTATEAGTIDRKGYDYAQIDVMQGTAAATTGLIVCALAHSDSTDATTFTVLTDVSIGTETSYITPVATDGTSTTPKPYATLGMDLRGLGRYIKCSITPGGVTPALAVLCTLTNGDESQVGATNQNVKIQANQIP